MKFKTLRGKEKSVSLEKYTIDWDGKSLSKFQLAVKQFLRPFWENNAVFEEVSVTGTKMRLDLFNKTKMIGIEVMGEQHRTYSEFFSGHRSGFWQQKNRDKNKKEWCDLNRITLIEIYPEDLKKLSRQWFRDNWDIEI